MKRRRVRTPGISRIDQPEKRTHGYFVRLARRGKIYPAFFGDKTHGGKRRALKAAQKHYRMLLRKYGRVSGRELTRMLRRKAGSGIVGVRKIVVRRVFWVAHWRPRPYVLRQKMFSVLKYGDRRAKALAVQARKAGLRNMVERRRGAR